MAQKEIILCDSNILIELFKGNETIKKELGKIGINNLAISSITVSELIYGALNKKELALLENFLAQFSIVYVSETISELSNKLVYKYTLSHNLDVPDSLIAATCAVLKFKLYTLNKKDFKYIKEIELL